MNILITGGLGYIGGRIAVFLKKNMPSARIFLSTHRVDLDVLPSWTQDFSVCTFELEDEHSVNHCLKSKNFDLIIHLAAINEIESFSDPQRAVSINTLGTYRLLRTAFENNIQQFIYFSTFHVYGSIQSPVITEVTPTFPIHPYAITHKAAEDFVSFFRHYHGMKTLIFRLSNAYGYPMDRCINRWTLLVNDCCRQAVQTGKIVLHSRGDNFRDFIPLHDVARAVLHFIKKDSRNWQDGLYNLGGSSVI